MATGDVADLKRRTKALLPARWFQGDTPVLDGLLSGPAWALSGAYGLTAEARLQVFIQTATGGYLDLFAGDYFGSRLPRRPGQTDASYRERILRRLFRETNTLEALRAAIVDMTGREPVISTRRHPVSPSYFDGPGGYDVGLDWGISTPFTVYVIIYRPTPGSEEDGTTDAEILSEIIMVKPAGSKVGVKFRD